VVEPWDPVVSAGLWTYFVATLDKVQYNYCMHAVQKDTCLVWFSGRWLSFPTCNILHTGSERHSEETKMGKYRGYK
jgi:hypothetical protein